VEELAELLQVNGINALPYHAGLDATTRGRHQDMFLMEEADVIVATIAFGMGIDKPNVRYVLHYEFPDSLEAFYQEAGRAGRDGHSARTMAFIGDNDLEVLETRLLQRFPEKEEVKRIYNAICNFLQIAVGSGKDESYVFDLNKFLTQYPFDALVVYNSLKILELNKTLTFQEKSFEKTRIHCVVNNKILYDFQIRNKDLDPIISMIARTHPGLFENFVNLDEWGLIKSLKINKESLKQRLNTIEKQGIFEINWQHDSPQVTFLEERLPETHFYIKPEVLKTRKEVAIEKFSYVVDYLTEELCRSMQLVVYFGQKGEPCGICDVCKRKQKSEINKGKSIQQIVLEYLDNPKTFIEIKVHLAQADEDKIREILFELLDDQRIKFDGKTYQKS
jgi:ATP-dependent DNA helicase RecQ